MSPIPQPIPLISTTLGCDDSIKGLSFEGFNTFPASSVHSVVLLSWKSKNMIREKKFDILKNIDWMKVTYIFS